MQGVIRFGVAMEKALLDSTEIISCMHVQLDAYSCFEVLAVRGRPSRIKEIADRLIVTRGVKHGELVMTGLAENL